MHRTLHIAFVLGCLLLVDVASPLAAQRSSATDQIGGVLRQMRTDLSARRYAAAITRANGLLESARAITSAQRIELWQLLAAAYYPDAPQAQQPDSARLPLAALIRLAPDIRIARNLSWQGLDELTERVRAESFVVATRPPAGYILSARETGHLDVVATRPTRFRLISVDEASGRTVVHDSSAFVTTAALSLRTHDARGPIFPNGLHELHVWAYDRSSGDSVRVAHRVRALRRDLPASGADSDESTELALHAAPAAPRTAPPADSRIEAPHRSSMLLGGLALATATAVIAQSARPDGGLRSAFRVDARAFIVGAAMAGATVVNFINSRAPARPAAARTVVGPEPPPPTIDTYRVRLQIDPPER
jgi:hypothetical protein